METIKTYAEEYVFLDLAYPVPVYYCGKQYHSVLEGVQTLMQAYDGRANIDQEHRAWYLRHIMTHMLQWKFVCNEEMRQKLLGTENAILARGQSNFNRTGNEVMMEIRAKLQQQKYFFAVKTEDGEKSSSIKKYYKSFASAKQYLSTQSDFWSDEPCKADDHHILIYCFDD